MLVVGVFVGENVARPEELPRLPRDLVPSKGFEKMCVGDDASVVVKLLLTDGLLRSSMEQIDSVRELVAVVELLLVLLGVDRRI